MYFGRSGARLEPNPGAGGAAAGAGGGIGCEFQAISVGGSFDSQGMKRIANAFTSLYWVPLRNEPQLSIWCD
jgi:hypothetical protein